ncbi:anaphase-promoting complex APC subunit CDC26 [Nitzschia inconspicua]|uniref:Anaphase-promoting complex APC subunit CDC26 n=1 Tax=Nitzschia inconspicua TaxID=303405 RepID=A0A9K3L2N8_9STRA|nr:anaphase-promoting complex APC subunit CDC26 [Nitzschia inconspicua]
MALRRPPTRFELKGDDIEEYNKIMRERDMAKADTKDDIRDSSATLGFKFSSPATKKTAAMQRIGVTGGGGQQVPR